MSERSLDVIGVVLGAILCLLALSIGSQKTDEASQPVVNAPSGYVLVCTSAFPRLDCYWDNGDLPV